MPQSHRYIGGLWVCLLVVLLSSVVRAADPGLPLPADGTVNELKPGSILLFPYYTSSITASNRQNTRVSVTNTNPNAPVFLRLYFVLASSGKFSPEAAIDAFLCMRGNQTATFFASDLDPGINGFIIAIALDPLTGCPVNFNYLIGDTTIKLQSGFVATLRAQAIAAQYSGAFPNCDVNSTAATLVFDGSSQGYDRLPTMLAFDKLGSLQDGNDTLLILTSIGGSMVTGTTSFGSIQGTLYDDAGTGYNFSLFPAGPSSRQLVTRIFNDFPVTTPNYETVIPSKRYGWMKIWATNGAGLIGVAINFNSNAQSVRAAFSGGQNLRTIAVAASTTLTIPIFPPLSQC